MTDGNENVPERSFGEIADDSEDNVQGDLTEEVEETQETEGTQEETQEGVQEQVSETEPEGEPQLTEKGTKLDPNPQSAVHQQLANERAKARQYEQVLSNPQLLSRYMKEQFGETQPEAQPNGESTKTEAELKEYKAEDFENLDDVAKVVNSIQKGFADKSKTYEEQITQLSQALTAVGTYTQQQRIANTIEREVESISKYPEFDSKSPEYVEGLQEAIVRKFYELDYDQGTGFYKGQHSIAQMTRDALDNIQLGKKAGSLKAQTEVRKKAEGKVTTSSKVDAEVDEDTLSPADSIAKGIAKLGLR
jgi:hypothetical protein